MGVHMRGSTYGLRVRLRRRMGERLRLRPRYGDLQHNPPVSFAAEQRGTK